jgi:hypothetical protein
LRKAKKGKFLYSLEKYHIFLASKQDIHMNEFGIEQNNPIYDTIYKKLREYPHTTPSSTNTRGTPRHSTSRHQHTHNQVRTLLPHTIYYYSFIHTFTFHIYSFFFTDLHAVLPILIMTIYIAHAYLY